MQRDELLKQLTDEIAAVRRLHPVRVAIDGPDASGKTTLGDELAATLRDRSRVVIRASIDGFHQPRSDRYRRGELSPEGYYEESFDYEALRRVLLEPLGPDGSREYRAAVFDVRADELREERVELAPDDAILLFDGVFLLRAELRSSWDFSVFVDVAFAETLRRALGRDVEFFGSREQVERRYRERYIPGQRLYFSAERPRESADIVVLNDDVTSPSLERRPLL